MTITLPYGLSEAVPETAEAAWGARFIVTQNGHVDLPPDRHGFKGTDLAALGRDMEAAISLNDLRSRISGMLTTGILNTRTEGRVLIFTDENITIVGDTKASAGYLYVAAFRTNQPAAEEYEVTMTVAVNITVRATDMPAARAEAIETVVGAIEAHTDADAEVMETPMAVLA